MNEQRKIERLLEELEKANKLAKQLIELNGLNHRRFMAMRSRLAVLTVLHKDELEGMGFNIDRWIKDLELTPQQLGALTASLKRKQG